MKTPIIAVVGPGALGGLLASRWAKRAGGVFILGRSRKSESPWRQGRVVLTREDGSRSGLHRGIHLLRDVPPGNACSIVFFCVKSGDMAGAISASSPWIGPETVVVGLQNGLGHEKLLRRAFSVRRTVLGSCYVAADRPAPGIIAHTGGNMIWLSEGTANRDAAHTARRRLLQGGWTVKMTDREDRLLWTKLCFNAATNPLAALAAASNGQLSSEPALREITLAALAEAVGVARRSGHPPLWNDMAGVLLKAGRNAPHQRNSMLQDLSAGRPTEIKAILGPLIRAGRAQGSTPQLLTRLARLLGRLKRSR